MILPEHVVDVLRQDHEMKAFDIERAEKRLAQVREDLAQAEAHLARLRQQRRELSVVLDQHLTAVDEQTRQGDEPIGQVDEPVTGRFTTGVVTAQIAVAPPRPCEECRGILGHHTDCTRRPR